jgi:hypothetical protein
MNPALARAFAEALHAAERGEDGTPTLFHVRRVAQMVPAEARAVAWLHEALESTAVTEQELLMDGLTRESCARSGCCAARATRVPTASTLLIWSSSRERPADRGASRER